MSQQSSSAPALAPVIDIGLLFPNHSPAAGEQSAAADAVVANTNNVGNDDGDTSSQKSPSEAKDTNDDDGSIHQARRRHGETASTTKSDSDSTLRRKRAAEETNKSEDTRKQPSLKRRRKTVPVTRKSGAMIGIESKSTTNDSDMKHMTPSDKPSADDTWELHFRELKAYQEKNGHCSVPKNYLPHPLLPGWIKNQIIVRRGIIDRARGGGEPIHTTHAWLIEERIAPLDALGFTWKRPTKPRESVGDWDDCFQELKAFKNKLGHCNVPPSKSGLGKWVNDQRIGYRFYMKAKAKDVTEDHIKQMEDLGFSW